ncbi:TetR/AcrR family transcriptional regulator [Mesonia aestuariivivens]|uniref:TetR/AcrR family transcriptional regulator n=1 Tax=Mesonia aestuariivivens TaxID=2796128 RepID=A0ABS6W5H8_9FLAO|nr:TetR/AcrR family transcriptional regulator [Mesonia aestuariivivens]MBW2962369.1 TetR/AcrR family transcriptional regulator [Mesonia aestuariivivens]
MKFTTRKKEIIFTAAKLFRKKGYSAVSMRDLAQALDMKAASLYNHINSKQEILSIIILEVAENFTQHIDSVLPQEASSIEKLESVIENHIKITVEKTDALACLNNDWMHLEQLALENYLQMRNTYEAKMRSIIEQGIKEKELKTANIELVLFSLLSTLRTLYLWYAKNRTVSIKLLTNEMKQNLLLGIIL